MVISCLSCPSATFALQHGGFVPREWIPAKGLFRLREHTSATSNKAVDILACEQALHLKDVVKSHAREVTREDNAKREERARGRERISALAAFLLTRACSVATHFASHSESLLGAGRIKL